MLSSNMLEVGQKNLREAYTYPSLRLMLVLVAGCRRLVMEYQIDFAR